MAQTTAKLHHSHHRWSSRSRSSNLSFKLSTHTLGRNRSNSRWLETPTCNFAIQLAILFRFKIWEVSCILRNQQKHAQSRLETATSSKSLVKMCTLTSNQCSSRTIWSKYHPTAATFHNRTGIGLNIGNHKPSCRSNYAQIARFLGNNESKSCKIEVVGMLP